MFQHMFFSDLRIEHCRAVHSRAVCLFGGTLLECYSAGFCPNVTNAQIKDPVKLGMGLAATGIGVQIEAA